MSPVVAKLHRGRRLVRSLRGGVLTLMLLLGAGLVAPAQAQEVAFAPALDFATEAGPGRPALGDVNGDGKPDLAVANFGFRASTVSVFLNTTAPGATTPSFAARVDFATGASPGSVALGDVNGDGKPDLATANLGGTVSVFLNTTAPGATTPSFAARADFATGASPGSVALGDLNGDGRPDLATANYRANTVSVFLNTTAPGATTPSFAPRADFATGASPGSVALGDVNGDGKPDLVVANFGFRASTVSVFLNTTAPGATTPSFAARVDFATGASPGSVALGDVNGDGKPDLATANLGGTVSVFLNTTAPGATTPSFAARADFATGASPGSVALGDVNGDGKPDLAVANFGFDASTVSVFLNTTAPGATTPSFAARADFATGASPGSVALGDVNGDGKPDLATANLGGTVSVFLNTTTPGATTPSFAARADFATGASPGSVALGDLNGDGRPDLAVANSGADTVSVFLNTTTPGATAKGRLLFAHRIRVQILRPEPANSLKYMGNI